MAFDADAFLQTTVTGPLSTTITLCPEGEYKAFVDDGDKAILFTSGEKNGKTWASCAVMFQIADEKVKADLKRDKVLVPYKAFLDMNDAGTGLDLSEGRNVSLGRLRRALDQNDGTWSPLMMKGKGPVMVKVSWTSDQNDPEIKYANITRVSKITT